MKLRSPSYQSSKSFDKDSQSFDTVVVTYKLNKSTGELVESDKIDLQQLLNSHRESVLQEVLSRLEPSPSSLELVQDMRNDLLDDLDFMRDADSTRIELCEKYGLDVATPYDTLVSHLKSESDKLTGQIETLKKVGDNNVAQDKKAE